MQRVVLLEELWFPFIRACFVRRGQVLSWYNKRDGLARQADWIAIDARDKISLLGL